MPRGQCVYGSPLEWADPRFAQTSFGSAVLIALLFAAREDAQRRDAVRRVDAALVSARQSAAQRLSASGLFRFPPLPAMVAIAREADLPAAVGGGRAGIRGVAEQGRAAAGRRTRRRRSWRRCGCACRRRIGRWRATSSTYFSSSRGSGRWGRQCWPLGGRDASQAGSRRACPTSFGGGRPSRPRRRPPRASSCIRPWRVARWARSCRRTDAPRHSGLRRRRRAHGGRGTTGMSHWWLLCAGAGRGRLARGASQSARVAVIRMARRSASWARCAPTRCLGKWRRCRTPGGRCGRRFSWSWGACRRRLACAWLFRPFVDTRGAWRACLAPRRRGCMSARLDRAEVPAALQLRVAEDFGCPPARICASLY